MAYDKVVDSAALDAALTDVADAIREKGGTAEPMTLEEMPGKIAEIQAGGGATEPYVEETYGSSGNLIAAKLVGYTAVRAYMYSGCYALYHVEITEGLKTIGDGAFGTCESLRQIDLPASVTSIGEGAFRNCYYLELTELPAGLTSIASSAFSTCNQLALTELPAGLKTIGNSVFYNCQKITTLTFKGTPESIGNNALYGCYYLKTINVPWAEGAVAGAPWGATNATINYNYTGG